MRPPPPPSEKDPDSPARKLSVEEKQTKSISINKIDENSQISYIICKSNNPAIDLNNSISQIEISIPNYSDIQSFSIECIAYYSQNVELDRDDVFITVTEKSTTNTTLIWQDNINNTVFKPWLTTANYNDCLTNGTDCENTAGDTAQTYCETLTDGGYDWRLPTIEELEEEVTKCGGVLNSFYENINNTAYQDCYESKGFTSDYCWSSTTNASYTDDAWSVNFNDGNTSYYNKYGSGYVRCVRAGQ